MENGQLLKKQNMITNLESKTKLVVVEYNTAKLISFLCQVYLIIVYYITFGILIYIDFFCSTVNQYV